MATLQQLNRQAAATRNFLNTALAGGSIQGGVTEGDTRRLVASSPFLEASGAVVKSQSRQSGPSVIPGVGLEPGAQPLSGPSALLQSSGTVSRRFDTSGLDRRGNVVGRPDDRSDHIQLSQSDLQPILEELLNSIIGSGGTPQAQAASGQRAQTTQQLQQTIGQLTPEAAKIQSQALVDDIIRQTLDEILPQLQANTEAAGASQSALQNLQFNDLAARTAEKAAKVAVDAIIGFAQAQSGAGAVVERLTATDPLSDELTRLITGTPTESSSSSGPIDILNALGLLPDNLDPAILNSLLSQGGQRVGNF